ncbi:hypothetical protein RFI_22175 [Reticulomyxa filosa]|uniref:Uncharacterized protein n=1 Tax=Reticulomyxa filosa TaxID=46433 RepID=X6MQ12_RETFI|nr:hypothetical protein RFI_22175 [Reticulomyxa filosa]|eukprot:ETO15190.1 hypothetical protein RFI_22175 [Reticulomyxa filosa]
MPEEDSLLAACHENIDQLKEFYKRAIQRCLQEFDEFQILQHKKLLELQRPYLQLNVVKKQALSMSEILQTKITANETQVCALNATVQSLQAENKDLRERSKTNDNVISTLQKQLNTFRESIHSENELNRQLSRENENLREQTQTLTVTYFFVLFVLFSQSAQLTKAQKDVSELSANLQLKNETSEKLQSQIDFMKQEALNVNTLQSNFLNETRK